jgi:hypothetical protein
MNQVHTLSVKVFSQSMDNEHSNVRVDQIEVDVKLMLFICVKYYGRIEKPDGT